LTFPELNVVSDARGKRRARGKCPSRKTCCQYLASCCGRAIKPRRCQGFPKPRAPSY
jgi:hypothetical protein